MQRARLALLALAFLHLAACSNAAPAAVAPATPVVQTVEVTRVVEVEVTRVVTTTSPQPTATPAATAAATTTPTPPPAGGKWQVTSDTSSFDDSPRVVLSLDADRPIDGFLESHLPTLILRCQERQIEAYVFTGAQADVEAGNLDGATARIRIDDGAARTENMGKSTSGTSLFFENPERLIGELEGAQRLLFEFTPFNAAPAETSFDLRGLATVLPQLRTACGK